jgi:excisionase family DNA binding protein
VVLSRDDLVGIVRDAVREEIGAALGGGAAPEWLDAQGVAAVLSINARSVQKLVTRDGLPAHRVGAKLLRFRRDQVDAWLAERATRPGAHASAHAATLRRLGRDEDDG